MSVKINGTKVKMLIDSGSSVTIIDKNTFELLRQREPSIKLQKSKTKLYPYGSSEPLSLLGKFQTTLETRTRLAATDIYVLNKPICGNILSFEMCQSLNLLQVAEVTKEEDATSKHSSIINELQHKYKSVFKGTGKLRDYKCQLFLKENAKPVAQKIRRQPFHLRKKIKEKLDELEKKGIIEPVNTPQPWVSNIVVTPKTNGDIRVCLDARELNKETKRETFSIPTLDCLLDDMHDSKVFSKIDLRDAYNQIKSNLRRLKILPRLSPKKDFIATTDFVLVYQTLVRFSNVL